ncbi:asparaginase [Longivirga aurantiaca]|uniref:Asparaginase n=1 Tax=Longivirga aurantiaca TaxID=1837743 RepID=A0ABW1SWX6_9ACTN
MPDRSSVVLAEVVRSGFVEGVHRGSLVVLDADGTLLHAYGDITSPVFPRSSNKPMQAAGLVELGYAGRDARLAIAAASHWGEPHHLVTVREVLAAAGLDDSHLRTPADWPAGDAARDELVRAGGHAAPIFMNCSGKHAAMLATCVAQGWPLDDYRAADHPLQQHLAGTVARIAGETPSDVGIDGCGAPVLSLSLTALARAFSRCVTAEQGSPERLVADAMRAHPAQVGGHGHDATLFMQGVPGLLVKDGAEGVYAAALGDGRAVALKVDDGAARARPLLLAAALRSLGVQAPVLEEFVELTLLGGGVPVGAVRVEPALFA